MNETLDSKKVWGSGKTLRKPLRKAIREHYALLTQPIRQYEKHCETVKSNKQIFLENIDEIYKNDCLWKLFRTALGEVECRLWDERLFRRLDREKQRLAAAVKSGELMLPQNFYSKVAAGLRSARKPNESHVKSGKNAPQTVAKNNKEQR